MSSFLGLEPNHLIAIYGYWAIMAVVGLESMGVPLPGETVLVTAAIYAGTTHDLHIPLVIAAAAGGAIIGDNLGFWIGRELGFPLLLKHGGKIGLSEPRLKLGQYLFLRHGGKVVFFGRFVAFLRAFAALLAGANRMPWWRFLVFNSAGGVVWATLFGGGGYLLGKSIERYAGPIGIGLAIVVVIGAGLGFIIVRKSEALLVMKAERALPGPLSSRPTTRH